MFSKLAFKNIRRSIKDYAIYFFTLIFGIALFYVFNSLESQTIMLDVSERVRDMLKLVNVILGVVSTFVSFILGALIIYASRFLIKRRSKEFAIYLTLGMSKRKISLILLLETLLIGILSLGAGLLLGIFASQFTSVLVANMFDASLTHFQFVFSLSALLKTLAYFGVIYLIVMIFNTIIVSRQSLIKLFSSSRANERVKMKNPWLCTIVFLLASTILGIAYYLVTSGLDTLMSDGEGVERLLIPIIMGTVATFALFWSLSGLLLRILISLKKVYYHGLNTFVLRQFSSKINTMVVSMSLICLMLFVTICILGSALSINKTLHTAIEQSLPMDVQIESFGRSAIGIEDVYRRDNTNLDDLLKDIVSYQIYRLADYDLANTLGDVVVTLDDSSAVSASHTSEVFVHQSDYNRVAPIFHLDQINLADDEYAVIANYDPIVKLRNQALAQNTAIQINGKTLHPKFTECIHGTLELEAAAMNGGVIIVPDDLSLAKGEDVYVREIMLANFADANRAEAIERQLLSLNQRFFNDDAGSTDESIYYYSVDTRQEIIDNNVGTSAMVTFIGLYLGLIFLISSAAVLALKELSESSDNRAKYDILRRIGASEKMLNRALFWQIFIFFLFPLLIAVLHATFGLKFCNYLLLGFGGINIAHILPGVTSILLIVYGGYFAITYFCGRNIIRAHRK